MNVKLINYTPNAADLLIFTKNTRLEMSPTLLEDISKWPWEKKLEELDYMANTLPSSWEFVHYTFLVTGVSRSYTHQQVRTRLASYAQQSLRVVAMKQFDFVMPERIQNHPEMVVKAIAHNARTQVLYNEMLEAGIPVEDARAILPINVATNIVCDFNLASFSNLAASRTGGRTQGEYQKVVNAMVDEVLKVHHWAEKFLFKRPRHYFDEIEAFAEAEYGGDLLKKGKLLKIVDAMRKSG